MNEELNENENEFVEYEYEIWENQRKSLFGVYSPNNMIPKFDPAPWTTTDGKSSGSIEV